MGRQIIKQPDGKYCVFSSEIDNIVYYDCTPKDLIKHFAEDEVKSVSDKVNRIVKQLDDGVNPYYQFTNTFDEMLQIIEDCHGKEELKHVKDVFNNKVSTEYEFEISAKSGGFAPSGGMYNTKTKKEVVVACDKATAIISFIKDNPEYSSNIKCLYKGKSDE